MNDQSAAVLKSYSTAVTHVTQRATGEWLLGGKAGLFRIEPDGTLKVLINFDDSIIHFLDSTNAILQVSNQILKVDIVNKKSNHFVTLPKGFGVRYSDSESILAYNSETGELYSFALGEPIRISLLKTWSEPIFIARQGLQIFIFYDDKMIFFDHKARSLEAFPIESQCTPFLQTGQSGKFFGFCRKRGTDFYTFNGARFARVWRINQYFSKMFSVSNERLLLCQADSAVLWDVQTARLLQEIPYSFLNSSGSSLNYFLQLEKGQLTFFEVDFDKGSVKPILKMPLKDAFF